jgi:hypothetical protein
MTGYLQRLVATAVQGQAGLRPIVRPPGTGRAAEDPAVWPVLGDDAGTRAAATATSPAAPEVPDLRGRASDTPAPPAGSTRGLPRTVPAPQPASSPGPAPELLTPLFGTTPAARPAAPALAAGAGSVARPPAGYRPLPGAAPDRSRAMRARDTPAGPDGPGPEPARARPGPAAPPQMRQQPQHLAGRAVPERAGGADGGDIEIHIGRIEVTAVTAPPVAPAAKAARKSINLGDYLRNGR